MVYCSWTKKDHLYRFYIKISKSKIMYIGNCQRKDKQKKIDELEAEYGRYRRYGEFPLIGQMEMPLSPEQEKTRINKSTKARRK